MPYRSGTRGDDPRVLLGVLRFMYSLLVVLASVLAVAFALVKEGAYFSWISLQLFSTVARSLSGRSRSHSPAWIS